MVAKHYVRDGL